MRVVVSGGTGFVGRSLCHALVGRGDDVVVLTRGPARDLSHACRMCGSGGTVSLVSWTPEKAGDWMRVVDGADAVIHLAGAGVADERWTPERKELLRSSRIVSTELLSEAIAAAARKPSVFVSASAVGRYGTQTGDEILDESAAPGHDFLAQLTVDWENAAQAARDAGVRVVHPRFGIVLGMRGGVYAKLRPIFKSFVGGPVGSGKQYVPWVHVRDAVSALEAMLDRRALSGAYNIVGPEPVTMNTFAEQFAASLGRPCAMRVPALALKLRLGAERAEIVLTGQRAVPKRLVEAGYAFLFADVSSALADLARESSSSSSDAA